MKDMETSNKTKLIRELIQGRELATQLLNVLKNPSKEGDSHVLAQDIIAKILNSFTGSLSVVSCESNVQDLGTCCDDQRSEGSSESRKRPAAKDKRGCYKRRKDTQTWTTVSTTLDDSHAWRKYGQKEILNSKFPRAYFRCTRKYEQGCKATKQVQKMKDDPNLYHITYIGVHTCKDLLKAPHIFTEDSSPYWKSCIVFSSESKNIISSEKELDFSSCTTTAAVKQESPTCREETPAPSELTTENNNTSSLNSMFWSTDLDTTLMSPSQVYSCTDTSSHVLDFDDFVGSEDFSSSDFFHF